MLKLSKKDTIIILAPSTVDEIENDEYYIANFVKVLSKNKDIKCFLNPHPFDRQFHPSRFENYNIPVLSSTDFYRLLPHSTSLLTPSSTICLEAVYCKVPVLGFDNYEERNWEFPYFSKKYKVGLRVNPKNIFDAIYKIESNYYNFCFSNFISRYLYSNDGLAYRRMTYVIDILEKHKVINKKLG